MAVGRQRRPSTQLASAEVWKKAGWLPSIEGLDDWYGDLAAKHQAAAGFWREQLEAVDVVLDGIEASDTRRREEIDELLVAGKEPRPVSDDGLIGRRKLALARRRADDAEEQLCLCVVECLAVLRAHRGDLAPHMAAFDDDTRKALRLGAGAWIEERREALQQAQKEAADAITILDEHTERVHA